ncbi:hypothetical protein GCK32_009819 [Trichostrongylus colubriformis]|uniref:Transthyretin-like family protein n=1 Tax=Trichostrongylus colubriformis TaxID=6319 RepID=A0AAN8ESP9_TRICO
MYALTVIIAFSLLPSCGGLFGIFGTRQQVTIKGEVDCYGKPAAGVKLLLLAKRWIFTSELDKKVTNNTGKFVLNGTTTSLWPLQPRIIIHHKCNRHGTKKCALHTLLHVPRDNVTVKGNIQRIFLDYGKIPLESLLLHTVCAR